MIFIIKVVCCYIRPPSRPVPRMKVSGPWAHDTEEVGMRN